MTKKELNAMNGKVESYPLNKPMSWKEFKAMPDDIKVLYIKLLREKFGAPDSYIAEMMGINKCTFSQTMVKIGCVPEKKSKGYKWDKDGFYAWVGGTKVASEEPEEPVPEEPIAEQPVPEVVAEAVTEPLVTEEEHTEAYTEPDEKPAIPFQGNMTFEGKVDDILKSVRMILGNSNVRINFYWEVKEDGN
jgi:hypothetical protein